MFAYDGASKGEPTKHGEFEVQKSSRRQLVRGPVQATWAGSVSGPFFLPASPGFQSYVYFGVDHIDI